MARLDTFGMFWEDATKVAGETVRVMAKIPETGWKHPESFPNLDSAVALGIDTETYDPDLMDRGPGWARGRGHIVGFSVSALDRLGNLDKWYFPIKHELCPEENMDPEPALAWLKYTLSHKHQPKVGANLLYDLGWLREEGIEVQGELHDVQFMEALLNENHGLALDTIAEKYLGENKITEELYLWSSMSYGGPATQRQRANIYRSPPSLVGPYAEADAELPLKLMDPLFAELTAQGLERVYNMERALIRLTLDMRWKGQRVDVAKAEKVGNKLELKELELQAQLDKDAKFKVNINSSAHLKRVFDKAGYDYPLTEKGNPSFAKGVLEGMNNSVSKLILEIRKLAKLRGTFIESYILDSHIDGRIYGQFHALRNDGGGTRSGRWSSSNPNLQNIPARDKVWAPILRSLFIPDEGHKYILAPDFSSIEYRFLAHFARGEAGAELRKIFIADPTLDFHQVVSDIIHTVTGVRLTRKHTKNVNFGLCYGMGKPTLRENLGIGVAEGDQLFTAYHKGAPYVKATMDYYANMAQNTGYIRTIMGRRSRFELWEPADWKTKGFPLPYNAALNNYGDIKRASTHKALNRVLQGSAADGMKKSMLECYRAGLFDGENVPHLTVHDELVFSTNATPESEWAREVEHTMSTALTDMRVPLLVDMDYGPDWGHVSATGGLKQA